MVFVVINFNTNIDNKDEWLTPLSIIQGLGNFDLDPCAPIKRPWDMALNHFTIEDDGLKKKWFGRVWCNPPYGRKTFQWISKLHKHGNGIALIFARTETIGFHTEIWNKADGIFFFRGRIHFYTINGIKGGPANAPSCLVSYGKKNNDSIKRANFDGKFISLKSQ